MSLPQTKSQISSGIYSSLLVPSVCLAVLFDCSAGLAAATTNLFPNALNAGSLPDAGPSFLRVIGALALVIGLFLGGAWLLRNGRLNAFNRGRVARLNVLESRSLGARQAVYVVGYGQERFLIGSTPAGINLLSHLAAAPDGESSPAGPAPSFAQALTQVLRGTTAPGRDGKAK
jgi:flagellar biosynthetic protein FliO